MQRNITITDILSNDIPPFILGCLFSKVDIKKENIIEIKYSYKKSDYFPSENADDHDKEYISSREQTKERINNICKPYNYWQTQYDNKKIGKTFIVLHIKNDLNLSKTAITRKIYKKIFESCDWVFDAQLNSSKKEFIAGFMESRGSIDTGRPYIAQDYFFDDLFELRRVKLLDDFLNVPTNKTNINFRETQEQFVRGIKKRNTQYRINIFWYSYHIGILNPYKLAILKNVYTNVHSESSNNSFTYLEYPESNQNIKYSDFVDSRLNFYAENIFTKNLSENDINQIRKQLELSSNENYKQRRNREIVETVRIATDDFCDSCRNEYDIADRTFIHKRTGRPYFEIHHVISLGNNHELDEIENLSKLCPVCHTALKKSLSSENTQIGITKKILQNNEIVRQFCENFYNIDEIDILATEIQKALM